MSHFSVRFSHILVRSYLTNQTFYVNIGEDTPSPGELLCGDPQGSTGSTLGPLIFLQYANDMPQAVD